jgi:hypothetical protein
MAHIVLWSFVMALTPVVLALAWKLISGIGNLSGLKPSRAPQGARQAAPPTWKGR